MKSSFVNLIRDSWPRVIALVRMPRYVFLDTVGKTLMLASLGWQVLVLDPVVRERDEAATVEALRGLVTLLQLNDPEFRSDRHAAIKITLDGFLYAWDTADMARQRGQMTRRLTVPMFFLGSAMTIVAVWMEKRKKFV